MTAAAAPKIRKPVVSTQLPPLEVEDESESKMPGDPRDYLKRIANEEYNICGLPVTSPKLKCTDPAVIRERIEVGLKSLEHNAGICESKSIAETADDINVYLACNAAAMSLSSLGVNPKNVGSFWKYLSGTQFDRRRIAQIIGSLGVASISQQFLSVEDPKNSRFSYVFDNQYTLTNVPNPPPPCSYDNLQTFGQESYIDLQDELESWANGNFLCLMPDVPQETEEAVATGEEKPAAEEETTTTAQPPAVAAPAVATPSAVPAATPPPAKTPTEDITDYCETNFPDSAMAIWNRAKPATLSDVAGTSWVRCGYNAVHDTYTPSREIQFDPRGKRIDLDVSGTGWVGYDLEASAQKMVGLFEDKAKWLVPPQLGGPRGNWGPLELRVIGDKLLGYFRTPSTDGKDYFYAYFAASRKR